MRILPLTFRSCALSFCLLTVCSQAAKAGVGDQIGKLLAGPGDTLQFGTSIAIDNGTIVVGGLGQGAAYIFDQASGTQLAKLLPSDGTATHNFGYAVALNAQYVVVSANNDTENGQFSGSAYIFDRTTGAQLFKLVPADGQAFGFFGQSLAISGDTILVGTGMDVVYVYDATTGLEVAQWRASDDDVNADLFGSSLAVSGNLAVIGAAFDDDNANDAGSAYLFDLLTGTELVKLLPDDAPAGAFFGSSVAISGSTVVVGAYSDDSNGFDAGSAYLFDASTGAQLAKLSPNDGAATDLFGISVAISGTTVCVGALRDDDNGFDSGSAYLFDASTGMQFAKLLPTDGAQGDEFGWAVAIEGTATVIGARNDDDEGPFSGSAYIFEAPATAAFTSDVLSLSLTTGGQQALNLDGGSARAGWFYFVFGSVTGTTPGIDFGGGVQLPLNADIYFNLTLTKPGIGAFGGFMGTLDSNGQALASFTLPPLMDPSLIGVELNHAYLAASVLGIPEFASNPVSVLLVP